MKPVNIHLIAGARPNFMKVAPLYHALIHEAWCNTVLVHTGQHYDADMSETFFQDLKLPTPHIHLGVGGGTHAEQTARIMVAYEKVCQQDRPDWVIVVGDVNSTLACTLAAKKLCIAVAHLEAGLRSGDRTMPEEINRIVTDAIADLLWTPSTDADENLKREGIADTKIARVGNIMMDSYELLRTIIESERCAETLGLKKEEYGVVTLHRPANVDDRESLITITDKLREISGLIPLVFPVHPRTRERLQQFGLLDPLVHGEPNLRIENSMGYLRFMSLVRDAKLVITDSGGVQEETTYLGIPCLTLRESTERPITITKGTNRLVSSDTLVPVLREILCGDYPRGVCPELWDGNTASRVVSSLRDHIKE